MKPILLDAFCGAGGCAKGYQDAGFYVVGVDIKPQPRYIGDEFHQADALEFIAAHGAEFDVIHASPPCQEYSNAQRIRGNTHPDLIGLVRKLLQATGKPYIIENVPGAPLIDPTLLTGTMFNLMTIRPRLFETNFELPFLMESPRPKQVKMGRAPKNEGDYVQIVGHFSNVPYARRAMDIDWMTRDELKEAIPPAYTKWIGERIIELVTE